MWQGHGAFLGGDDGCKIRFVTLLDGISDQAIGLGVIFFIVLLDLTFAS